MCCSQWGYKCQQYQPWADKGDWTQEQCYALKPISDQTVELQLPGPSCDQKKVFPRD